MVTLYEGIVMSDVRVPTSLIGTTSAGGSTTLDPLIGTMSVFLEEPQITVNATVGSFHNMQMLPQKFSKVLVYRTYNDQARIVSILTEPNPRPVWSYNSTDTAFFKPGEVAIQAVGSGQAQIPQDGGLIWCQNSGDVSIYSGSQMQGVFVSDTTESVSLNGSNISIASNTSSIATQAFQISTDLDGLSSSAWGIQNPTTGIFTSRIAISSLGEISLGSDTGIPTTINIGLVDPVLGIFLQGISVATTGTPLAPLGEISLLTLGDIVMKALDVAIVAPTIYLTGITDILGDTSIEGKISLTGATSILGNTSITGRMSVLGDTSLTGIVDILGPTTVVGPLNVEGIYSVAGIPGLSGTFVVGSNTITVVGGLVTAIV